MPEETTEVKPYKVICRWCNRTIGIRSLQRHFSECLYIDPIGEGQKACSKCQDILPIPEFVEHCGRIGTTCKSCVRMRSKSWRERHPEYRRGFNDPGRMRPGRWGLRPCPLCGELFSGWHLRLHKPRCPHKKPSKKVIHSPVPYHDIANSSELHKEAVQSRGRVSKNHSLKLFYGISIEDYEGMIKEQGGKCAICHLAPSGHNSHNRSLHVDHDHATGKVRGLVCYNCNHGLGNFKDNPALLMAAMNYLLSHTRLAHCH